jgi:hypothetical protein
MVDEVSKKNDMPFNFGCAVFSFFGVLGYQRGDWIDCPIMINELPVYPV